MELGVSLAKVATDVDLTRSGGEDLHSVLTEFVKATQGKWNRFGRRKSRVLARNVTFFAGDIVVPIKSGPEPSDKGKDGRQSRSSGGRPTTPYAEQSERSK